MAKDNTIDIDYRVKEFIKELPPICGFSGIFIDLLIIGFIIFTVAIIKDSSDIKGAILISMFGISLILLPYFIITLIINCCVINVKNKAVNKAITKYDNHFGTRFGISGLIWYVLTYGYKLKSIESMSKVNDMITDFNKLITPPVPTDNTFETYDPSLIKFIDGLMSDFASKRLFTFAKKHGDNITEEQFKRELGYMQRGTLDSVNIIRFDGKCYLLKLRTFVGNYIYVKYFIDTDTYEIQKD